MTLPFTVEQFIEVFRQYNMSIWPMQVIAYLFGAAAVLLVFHKINLSDRITTLVLSFFWLWMGISYHWMHFAFINKAAYIFGAIFVFQAFLFVLAGLIRKDLSFGYKQGVPSAMGIIFVFYGMIGYPLLGYFLGHIYPASPCFGVAPCPTTIFTFGLLLLTVKRVPKYLLIIPLIWSFIGFTAALKLGIKEDIGLLIAGVATLILTIKRDKTDVQAQRG